MSEDKLSLAIIDSNEDSVLISKPFCEKCAIIKLKVLIFCKISNKEAEELIKIYKMSSDVVLDTMFPDKDKKDKKDRKKNGNICPIRLVRVKCECAK
jgi:hypothetical protein